VREEPRCRVIALEPSPENFASLRQNLALLGADARVEIHQLGIGGQVGRVKMSDIPTNRSIDARTVPAEETDVAAVGEVPLSHLFELAGTRKISLLKMDAEGAEYGAFSTADAGLFARIERIAMEYHDNLVPGTPAMPYKRLAPSHEVTVVPDSGQMHGKLFAVRKDLATGPG